MDEGIKFFVGLDVHKDSIVMGVGEAASRLAARLAGRMAHDVPKMTKAPAKLGAPSEVEVVYEAGPTGYGLQRALLAKGYRCEVIAPSLIPRRAGDRIKTDGRDCLRLAESSRAGELRAVWVPDARDEGVRDLSRAREDAVNARTQARLDHQDRQRSRPTSDDRGGLELPLQAAHRSLIHRRFFAPGRITGSIGMP